jgi:hypothetical protein
MMNNKELDKFISEEVMGISLIPHPDRAKEIIGFDNIRSTGPTFFLKDGREIVVPEGRTLPDPDPSVQSGWDARCDCGRWSWLGYNKPLAEYEVKDGLV